MRRHTVDTWMQSEEYINSRIQGEEEENDNCDDGGKLGDSVEEGEGLFYIQFSLIGFSESFINTLITQKNVIKLVHAF